MKYPDYCNWEDLPDCCLVWVNQCHAMLLVLFFCLSRFVQYNQTTLERNYKFELLTEHDLGVTIDLINPETYKIDFQGTSNKL